MVSSLDELKSILEENGFNLWEQPFLHKMIQTKKKIISLQKNLIKLAKIWDLKIVVRKRTMLTISFSGSIKFEDSNWQVNYGNTFTKCNI